MSEERNYLAIIAFGRGNEVSDEEFLFRAPNFVTAAAIAHGLADRYVGELVHVEETNWNQRMEAVA